MTTSGSGTSAVRCPTLTSSPDRSGDAPGRRTLTPRPGGGTGRRRGLKPPSPATGVRVRTPPRAPLHPQGPAAPASSSGGSVVVVELVVVVVSSGSSSSGSVVRRRRRGRAWSRWWWPTGRPGPPRSPTGRAAGGRRRRRSGPTPGTCPAPRSAGICTPSAASGSSEPVSGGLSTSTGCGRGGAAPPRLRAARRPRSGPRARRTTRSRHSWKPLPMTSTAVAGVHARRGGAAPSGARCRSSSSGSGGGNSVGGTSARASTMKSCQIMAGMVPPCTDLAVDVGDRLVALGVPDPHDGRVLGRVAGEPGVGVALGRAGLGRHRTVERRSAGRAAAGALGSTALTVSAMPASTASSSSGSSGSQEGAAVAVLDLGDDEGVDAHPGAGRSVLNIEASSSGLTSSVPRAIDGSALELAADAEAAGRARRLAPGPTLASAWAYTVLTEAAVASASVMRPVLLAAGVRHRPRPALDVEGDLGRCRVPLAGAVARLEVGRQDHGLERRAGLAARPAGPAGEVDLQRREVTSADPRSDGAGAVDADDRGLRVGGVVEVGRHGRLGRALVGQVERRVHDQALVVERLLAELVDQQAPDVLDEVRRHALLQGRRRRRTLGHLDRDGHRRLALLGRERPDLDHGAEHGSRRALAASRSSPGSSRSGERSMPIEQRRPLGA